MSDILSQWLPLALAGVILLFYIKDALQANAESKRKDRVIEQLLNRLMSRDLGEYSAGWREYANEPREEMEPFFRDEAENILGYQTLGDDAREEPRPPR